MNLLDPNWIPTPRFWIGTGAIWLFLLAKGLGW